MNADTLKLLTNEFDVFLDAHPHLADLDSDAVELLMFADLTAGERAWLEAFCARWRVLDAPASDEVVA